MTTRNLIKLVAMAVTLSVGLAMSGSAHAAARDAEPDTLPRGTSQLRLLTSELGASTGSTVGPDGGIYVVDGAAGVVRRVDPHTGRTSTVVTGLPQRVGPYGGPVDIAFIGRTAYVLVTLVSPDVGGASIDGIYRIDAPGRATPIADIGTWAIAHPPATDFFVPSGVLYALQPFRGGFLVTDGHHNRLLRVALDGAISQFLALGNVVPTGLAVRGTSVFISEAGPVPHLPQDGAIVALRHRSSTTTKVASGAPLLVDVEFGPGHAPYALSQGHFSPGHDEGSPADPRTGGLFRADPNGTLTELVSGLDRPTALEFVGNHAYVVTLTGQLWTIDIRGNR